MGNFPDLQICFVPTDITGTFYPCGGSPDDATYSFECSASQVSAFATSAETDAARTVEINDLNTGLAEQRAVAAVSANDLFDQAEEEMAPDTPNPISPVDTAVGQELTISAVWIWTPALSGQFYDVQVSTSGDFAVTGSYIYNEGYISQDNLGITGADNTMRVLISGLSYETDYWWRMRARKTGGGGESAWTTIWKFTTKARTVPTYNNTLVAVDTTRKLRGVLRN